MTGYGKDICHLEEKSVTIEIRSLNSKNLDLSIRIPQLYKEKEHILRNRVAQALERGKVELVVSIENKSDQTGYTLNKPLITQYFGELKEVATQLGTPVSEQLLAAIMRLPEVLKQESQQLDEAEWKQVLQALDKALQQTLDFRESEGEHLEKDLQNRIEQISGLLQQITPFEAERVNNLKYKLLKSLEELKDSMQHDPNRLEQELIYYLEKLDITEEKVRLSKHLEYFIETLKEPANSGKKLGFITQEIGREINTIGSKANDAAIQKLVVQMKDELEKIKEQLMNIL
jgi:uncharacterized protein (TIGR00255 family)